MFLTWTLAGSLPCHRFPPPNHDPAGRAFVGMDRFLDQAGYGPTWMRQEAVAQIIVDALRFAAGSMRQFDLHAYAVMPNHVHMLVTPQISVRAFMQSVKGFTAREANKVLGRTGQPFWQHESYDHWVRDDEGFHRIARYIEENPVRAGLVVTPEDYRWSSAYAGTNAGMAG